MNFPGRMKFADVALGKRCPHPKSNQDLSLFSRILRTQQCFPGRRARSQYVRVAHRSPRQSYLSPVVRKVDY